MSIRDRWESRGHVAFRLPSGFVVIGVWPAITDLARRGVLPFELRQAVLLASGKKLGDVTQEDVSNRLEQRMRIAASFVRALYDDETGEEEATSLTLDDLEALPGEDVETLDTFVTIALSGDPAAAALRVNEIVERNLFNDAATVEEAGGDTLDDLAGFRGERRGQRGNDDGADVADAAEPTASDRGSASRVSRRRRSRSPAPD